MEDKEYFLRLVALREQDIVIEQVQALQLGNNIDQEVLRLVPEESDTFDNLAMSGLNHISS